ncbi:hypothetical protein [Desulfovibrio sp. JC022]|uniref:hypothetical protein n=1 Tax=Desulfovibrio sp. JC022 TaxID=2593642 RepID=UPI0013D5FAB0|nr:hypothetical protein [Desulfovibrio sp. JC022]NDV23485.1 hypothetical protein [Desulfovibrio sp. JC022]
MKKTIVLLTIFSCALLYCLPVSAAQMTIKNYSFEKKKASKDWSPRKTFIVGENRRLGLFNDRNKRFPSTATLTVTDLPAGRDLELTFDMVFVGSWDNEGKLADKFTISIVDGPELLNMTEFPCTLIDNDDSRPVGNNGVVKVGPKDRAFWIKPMNIKIPASTITDGSIKIKFKGFLTGRKTEYWALDNVKIISK